MFAGFARQWTPLLPLSEVTSKPRREVLAGEALVIWRVDRDTVAVLLDRCPHRGVSLSLGSRTQTGRLACSFHGWQLTSATSCWASTSSGARGICSSSSSPRRTQSSRAAHSRRGHRARSGSD